MATDLVSFIELSLPQMMLSMANASFDADNAWLAHASKYKSRGASAISHALRDKGDDGLHLQTTDIDWSWGTGTEVSGPAKTLLLAINRRDMSAELTGAGMSRLPTS